MKTELAATEQQALAAYPGQYEIIAAIEDRFMVDTNTAINWIVFCAEACEESRIDSEGWGDEE
jgi:hypothetical protein